MFVGKGTPELSKAPNLSVNAVPGESKPQTGDVIETYAPAWFSKIQKDPSQVLLSATPLSVEQIYTQKLLEFNEESLERAIFALVNHAILPEEHRATVVDLSDVEYAFAAAGAKRPHILRKSDLTVIPSQEALLKNLGKALSQQAVTVTTAPQAQQQQAQQILHQVQAGNTQVVTQQQLIAALKIVAEACKTCSQALERAQQLKKDEKEVHVVTKTVRETTSPTKGPSTRTPTKKAAASSDEDSLRQAKKRAENLEKAIESEREEKRRIRKQQYRQEIISHEKKISEERRS